MILYSATDDYGTLRVVQKEHHTDLLFDEDPLAIQSRIDHRTPRVPSLEYIKSMCLCRSLVPRPNKILILGHGGGSLAKFYSEQFPKAHFDVVDVREELWKVSTDYFQYNPVQNTVFYVCDALKFVEGRAAKGEEYDIVLVDLYIDGPANVMAKPELWDSVAKITAPLGFAAANVWRFDEFEKLHDLILDKVASLYNTVARTNLVTNQCILYLSHLDANVLDTPHLVGRTEYDTISTGVPLSRILRNTRILK
tara:strand:- start:713 stop:1468 length:756 start_codon:yes stop_codon:yes gene_type:complete